MTKNPYVSVIIPALNEQKYLKYPISGLKEQNYKDFETIVVDGGSRDGTVEMAKRHAKVITELRRGIAIGRNTGASIAKGKIYVFLDADTKPSKDLISNYVKAFDNDKAVIAATGPIYPLERTNLRIRWGYEFVSVLFVKFTILIGMPSIVGSNFAVRASAFKKVHGFDPQLLTYEDWDLSNKLKKLGKIAYLKDATVKTSARRVVAWGVWGYFVYHVINMFMYNFLKKARKTYKAIR